MKTHFNLRILFITALLAAYGIDMYGQTFPQLFNDDQYDLEHGAKGRIFRINTDNVPYSTTNKAIIFQTLANNQQKDLMRLTEAGITTFQSPSSPVVKLDLYANDGWQGYILGSQEMTHIVGKTQLKLGINASPAMLLFKSDSAVFNAPLKVNDSNVQFYIGHSQNGNGWMGTYNKKNLKLGTGQHDMLEIDTLSNVYININPYTVRKDLKDKYSLFVAEGVLAEDVAIAPKSSWADYVFAPGYRLKPLGQVKQFIGTNRHLPDVPSAEKIREEGYSQHDMNKVLLQKIEELTLYMIQQNEQIEQQNKRIRELEAELK